VILDRTNHHVFQPLLYQVATSVLTAGQIGSPIRGIIGRNSNTTVILGEVTGVDKDKRCVFVSSVDRRYAGLAIYRRVARFSAPEPFRYFDKGNLAVVGKGFAVLQSGKVPDQPILAWLAWAGVHLLFLAQSSLRVSVFVQWVWTYLTGQRGSRLIVNHHGAEPTRQTPKAAHLELANKSK
jgi:NADH dehydrogenase FAD-containing subunit